jgi:glyoxylase-like metal-dependent hydrolase (beta-lactamase superfamily II)
VALTPEIALALHVVVGEERSALVDSGLPISRPLIDQLLAHADERGAPVRYAATTHAHHDHIGNHRYLQSRGGLVVAAEGSRWWLADPDVNLREFAFHHPHILGPTDELLAELRPTFDGPIDADVLVGSSVVLDLGGGVELEGFRVDGHLPSELAWFERSTRVLVLGDAVTGIDWPFFHGHLAPDAFRHTLRELAVFVRERDVAVVAMSHYAARGQDDFLRLLTEVAAYLDRVDHAVRDAIRRPSTLESAWRSVCTAFGKEPEFRSLGMVAAHLDELVARGEAELTAPETYHLISTTTKTEHPQ